LVLAPSSVFARISSILSLALGWRLTHEPTFAPWSHLGWGRELPGRDYVWSSELLYYIFSQVFSWNLISTTSTSVGREMFFLNFSVCIVLLR
jgi:hypothetical protein